MRGHEDLIQMRKYGSAPTFVFINDYPCMTDWFDFGDHVTLCTDGDTIGSIDLRCVTGLQVSISGTSERRVKAISKLAKGVGAKLVAACVVDPSKPAHQQSGWCEIWRSEEVVHG